MSPPHSGPLVWASAVKLPDTGIGVLQRELYKRLEARGVRLSVQPRPPNRAMWAVLSFFRVVGRRHAAALVCTTPLPLLVRVPFLAFVYDLRWRRTRRPLARAYRYVDLRRTVAGAHRLYAISKTTRDELVSLFPTAAGRCEVLHLGPGIMDLADFEDGEPGAVLLAGGAGHKRNELVAEAFALARPSWARRFICVGTSDDSYRTLVEAFGEERCEHFGRVDAGTMRAIFRRAHVYVTASMEEGFGLPMVEALAAGCQILAIRQVLTEEVMGDSAVLLDDGDAQALAGQLKAPCWVPSANRRARAELYSWDRVADVVAAALVEVAR